MSEQTELGAIIGYRQNGLPIHLIGGASEPSPEGGEGSSDLPPPPPGVHPGWNPLMEAIPAELHPKVTPVLKEWSKGIDQSFQRFAPYKALIDRGIDPGVLEQGLGFYNTLASNPEQMFYALAEHLGVDLSSLGSTGGAPSADDDESQDPTEITEARYQELLERDNAMAQWMLQQREREEEAAAEAELDQTFKGLEAKYTKEKGYPFDEMWVLSRFESGEDSLEDVVKEYYAWQEQLYAQRPRVTPPIVLGSGGQSPSVKQDTSKMSIDDLNKYVAQNLAAFQQNQ